MKHTLKIVLVFGFLFIASACADDKNKLTKNSALEHLRLCEAKRPNIRKMTIPFGSMFLKANTAEQLGVEYYIRLFKEGYIKTELRTDIPDPKASYRPYAVVYTSKAEPYILVEDNNGKTDFNMYEIKAIEVQNITMITDTKADVTVVYKTFKTPFYNAEYDVSTNKNKPIKTEIYKETIPFRKARKSGWMSCHL